jgi:hypothetical protein
MFHVLLVTKTASIISTSWPNSLAEAVTYCEESVQSNGSIVAVFIYDIMTKQLTQYTVNGVDMVKV